MGRFSAHADNRDIVPYRIADSDLEIHPGRNLVHPALVVVTWALAALANVALMMVLR